MVIRHQRVNGYKELFLGLKCARLEADHFISIEVLRLRGVQLVCPISFHGMQQETLLLLLNSFSYFLCLVLCLTFMWEKQLDIVYVILGYGSLNVWCMLFRHCYLEVTELNKIPSDNRPCASQLNCYKEL